MKWFTWKSNREANIQFRDKEECARACSEMDEKTVDNKVVSCKIMDDPQVLRVSNLAPITDEITLR